VSRDIDVGTAGRVDSVMVDRDDLSILDLFLAYVGYFTVARVLDTDLRKLPPSPVWTPGSPVREVPDLKRTDVPDPGGQPAQDIFIDYWSPYQDTRWQYNPADGRYYRYNTGVPHIDAVTGQQLSTDNVVILEAEHIDRPDIYESETGGTVIETALWGRGTAWLFRDGLWYEGIWAHAQGRAGLWLLFPDRETPLHLKPGQTWFNVVRPVMYGVTISEQPVDAQATRRRSSPRRRRCSRRRRRPTRLMLHQRRSRRRPRRLKFRNTVYHRAHREHRAKTSP
jgi:hypothetical protein